MLEESTLVGAETESGKPGSRSKKRRAHVVDHKHKVGRGSGERGGYDLEMATCL